MRREFLAQGQHPGVLFEEVGPGNTHRWTSPQTCPSEDDLNSSLSPYRPPTPYRIGSPTGYRPQSATPSLGISRRSSALYGQVDNILTERTSDKDTSDDSGVDTRSVNTTRGQLSAAVTDTVLSRYLMPSPRVSQSSAYSTFSKPSRGARAGYSDESTGDESDAGTVTGRSGSTAGRYDIGATRLATRDSRESARNIQRPVLCQTLTEVSVLDEEDQIVISRAMFESDVSEPSSPLLLR